MNRQKGSLVVVGGRRLRCSWLLSAALVRAGWSDLCLVHRLGVGSFSAGFFVVSVWGCWLDVLVERVGI